MAIVVYPGVVLEDVSWEEYEVQLRIIGNRRIRVNYDGGRMEIVSPPRPWWLGALTYRVGSMVDMLTEELDIPSDAADPVTLKRADLGKGVEPDKLYFLGESVARVVGDRELDLTVDPPPDLIVERDATPSSVPRFPIFAALGILEVWRLDGHALQFFGLQPDRTYQPIGRSLAFSVLSLAEAARFLEQGRTGDQLAWMRAFRAFVREVLIPRRDEAGWTGGSRGRP